MGNRQSGDPQQALVNIEILDEAQEDLIQGFRFYESQERGLGAYFLDCLFSDIVERDIVRIHAVLDCRKNPSWIRKHLRNS